MKPTTTIIPLSLSLLTSLVSTAPISNKTVWINLNTGGGNFSTTVTVPYGVLFNASSWPKADGLIINYGAYTPTVCQAFSDAAGKDLLGASFKNLIPGASFHTDKPVQIRSIFCSDSAGVKARVTNSTTYTWPSSIGTAHIQLNSNFDPYVQASIPIGPDVNNPPIVPAGEVFKVPICQTISLESTDGIASGSVWCQAFSDLEGVNRLGKVFGANGRVSTLATDPAMDVIVGAIKCWTFGTGA